MFRNPIHGWLLRLCDPEGVSQLPVRRLQASQLVALLALAAEHGVTGAVLANLTTLRARDGLSRVLAGPISQADERAMDAHIAESRQRWFEFVAKGLWLRRRTAEVLEA